jgi:hypothetical protein
LAIKGYLLSNLATVRQQSSYHITGFCVGAQVPTLYSVSGAVLIIGCTLALGLFENKKNHTPIVPPEHHALLGHRPLDEETGRT